ALISKMSEETSLLPKGEIGLRTGVARPDQAAYRGLAAFRHLSKADEGWQITSLPALRALHSVMEDSAHLRKLVRLGDPAAGSMSSSLATPALAYSPKGDTLAVGDSAGSIHLLDAATYQERLVLSCSPPPGTQVWSIAFNGQGLRLAAGFIAE